MNCAVAEPPDVVTVTVTVPLACAGEVATIVVALLTVTLEAGVVPNDTVAVALKPVPVIVTVVSPVTDPDDGATPVTAGAVEDDGEDADVT